MPRQPTDGLCVVLSTLPDLATAERLTAQLVDERLIACGNLVPGVVSIFRWSGKVQREEEVLVVMKTPRSGVDRLFQRIAELHPYDVPELVSLAPETVSDAYCRWVQQETIEVTA